MLTSPYKVNARLAAVEEALSLSIWTVATVCRALSLESVIYSNQMFFLEIAHEFLSNLIQQNRDN